MEKDRIHADDTTAHTAGNVKLRFDEAIEHTIRRAHSDPRRVDTARYFPFDAGTGSLAGAASIWTDVCPILMPSIWGPSGKAKTTELAELRRNTDVDLRLLTTS